MADMHDDDIGTTDSDLKPKMLGDCQIRCEIRIHQPDNTVEWQLRRISGEPRQASALHHGVPRPGTEFERALAEITVLLRLLTEPFLEPF